MEALKNEQLVDVEMCKGKKANGSMGRQSDTVTKENTFLSDAIIMVNSNEDSLETIGVQKTANTSTITRYYPQEDIQPGVDDDLMILILL
ncbi:hypothetical protein ACOME3_006587 [Neoechinorhynchus agilis]